MEPSEPLSDCEVQKGSDQTGYRTHLAVRPEPAPHDRNTLVSCRDQVTLLQERSTLCWNLFACRDQTTEGNHVSQVAQ